MQFPYVVAHQYYSFTSIYMNNQPWRQIFVFWCLNPFLLFKMIIVVPNTTCWAAVNE